ncbi:hypothetical protein B0H17DRAFT_1077745 [Mycena rosella]|uniref:Uncharacterized protein n=1 Tax=Mycena rosella TaxID=1033263 RepID=A0AAD7GBG6_MYCRO|nr:hypothetical protein B0H17DRAFT_1077745 [Mycena rosella]
MATFHESSSNFHNFGAKPIKRPIAGPGSEHGEAYGTKIPYPTNTLTPGSEMGDIINPRPFPTPHIEGQQSFQAAFPDPTTLRSGQEAPAELQVFLTEHYRRLVSVFREKYTNRDSGGIGLHGEVLALRAPPHRDHGIDLVDQGHNLAETDGGSSVQIRFEQEDGPEDIDQAIQLQRDSLALHPPSDPDCGKSLNNLAVVVANRFARLGESQDINEAIKLLREALALHPPPHPNRGNSLYNLANTLWTRFTQQGSLKDIEEAIGHLREALHLQPLPHPDRGSTLYNLANALQTRFAWQRNPPDIEEAILLLREAIHLCPPHHPDRGNTLNSLAVVVATRFTLRGDLIDIDEAINLLREALTLCAPPHPNRAKCLENLAAVLTARFAQWGGLRDIDEAVQLLRGAVSLYPRTHPARGGFLYNLANTLRTRFTQLGMPEDIDEAIELYREGGNLTRCLEGLCVSLYHYYQAQGNLDGLDTALGNLQQAAEIISDRHSVLSSSLQCLAMLLHARYQKIGNATDLAVGLANHRKVVTLVPEGHAGQHLVLQTLAIFCQFRYNAVRDIADFHHGLQHLQKALMLIPEGDPELIPAFKVLSIFSHAIDPETANMKASVTHVQNIVYLARGYLPNPLAQDLLSIPEDQESNTINPGVVKPNLLTPKEDPSNIAGPTQRLTSSEPELLPQPLMNVFAVPTTSNRDVGSPESRDFELPVSTFVIYSSEYSTAHGQSGTPVSITSDEITVLETKFPNGGDLLSVHSPDAALLWVEAHYDDPLLKTIRTQGLGGPIAAMLSPDEPALVIFGSILDGWVHKAAKLLSDVSHFTVIIRPLADDPAPKWTMETDPMKREENDTDSVNIFEGDDTISTAESEDSIESMESIVSVSTDSESDAGSINLGSGVFRLRGGAGSADKYIPWKSPMHYLNIHLELQPAGGLPCKVKIQSMIQFTVQSRYTDKSRNDHRPQAISWTQLKVLSRNQGVARPLPDRSYSSTGFLVHGKPIFGCNPLPCKGFSAPHQVLKTAETKTRGMTATGGITGGLNPTGSATLAINRTAAHTVEHQNDRSTPKWTVVDSAGDEWIDTHGNSYEEVIFSYKASDPMEDQHQMEVEFSMGINVGKVDEEKEIKLPRVSFIIRNQTILWIANKSLKTKGHGIIVLTSVYIPDIKTSTEIEVEEREMVKLAGSSLADPPPTVKTAAESSARLSLAIGSPHLISNKLAIKSLTRRKEEPLAPQISTLPLHELKARGWDAETERWRVPVYPTLDSTLAHAPHKSTVHAWDLEVVEVSTDNLQDDHGPETLVPGNENIAVEAELEAEEGELKAHDLPKSKGKQRDPGPAFSQEEIVINVEIAEESDEAPAFTDPGTPSFISKGAPSTEGSFPEGSTPVSEFTATSFTTTETHALGSLLATEPGPSKLEDTEEFQ